MNKNLALRLAKKWERAKFDASSICKMSQEELRVSRDALDAAMRCWKSAEVMLDAYAAPNPFMAYLKH